MNSAATLCPIVVLIASALAVAQTLPAGPDAVDPAAFARWAGQVFGGAQGEPGRPADLPAELSVQPPFSFRYGGRSSRDFLSAWKRGDEGRRWVDPETRLEVSIESRLSTTHPAVEWLIRFRNGGNAETPVLEDILALDLGVTLPANVDAELHRAHGSTCSATDFLPIHTPVGHGADIAFAPNGGRSSDGALPFFNLQWPGGGVIVGIGWSGQWSARIQRNIGRTVTLRAGQQLTRLVLRPNEEIRTPRILLVYWRGSDHIEGQNLLRRVILDEYTPRINGQPVLPPVTNLTWFTFNAGNEVNEANQIESIRAMAPLGVECFWIDAGWFEGGWPSGVGSWIPKPDAFPRGLKPLGDAAHAAGMKMVVWFEPERVHPQSRIAREHPEYLLRSGDGDALFNLGDPIARRWLTALLSRCIEEWGIDIYRQDCNIEPIHFWRKADAPDRQGITEIRYIEGLYAMWDDLLARHPGLAIDNCASGGRRIDLELIRRSFPLWRSDTQAIITRPMPTQDQVQTAGLSLWVPLHSAGVWSLDPYTIHSIAVTGVNLLGDPRSPDYPAEQAAASIARVKRLRPLWLGDFYPLTEINLDPRHWSGWQLHRRDKDQGCAMLFRREASPYPALNLALRGIDPSQTYSVSIQEGPRRTMPGRELAVIRVEVPTAPGFTLIEYERHR